jgi:hypothetical protein
MDEKAQVHALSRRRRRRVLLIVKTIVFIVVAANLGLLVWYVGKHRPRLRVRGGGGTTLTAKPDALDFGQAAKGQSVARTITIKNRSGNEAVIQFVEFTDDSFHLQQQLGDLTLPAKGKAELVVVYEPHFGGTSNGEMRVRLRNQSAPDLIVPLVGVAVLPRLALSPGSLDFGEVATQAGARRRLKIENAGTAPLKVSGVAVRGSGFSLTKPFSPGTLSPRGSCTIEVAFVPPRQGRSAGELVITSDDPNCPEKTVGLSGSFGTAALKERDKAQAQALLDEAKQELRTAYACLTYTSSNRSLMLQRRQMGREAFEKAWPKYERANELLRSIDPALEDKEFYVDAAGDLQHR